MDGVREALSVSESLAERVGFESVAEILPTTPANSAFSTNANQSIATLAP
jgi:hypothetical protein